MSNLGINNKIESLIDDFRIKFDGLFDDLKQSINDLLLSGDDLLEHNLSLLSKSRVVEKRKGRPLKVKDTPSVMVDSIVKPLVNHVDVEVTLSGSKLVVNGVKLVGLKLVCFECIRQTKSLDDAVFNYVNLTGLTRHSFNARKSDLKSLGLITSAGKLLKDYDFSFKSKSLDFMDDDFSFVNPYEKKLISNFKSYIKSLPLGGSFKIARYCYDKGINMNKGNNYYMTLIKIINVLVKRHILRFGEHRILIKV